MSQDFPELSARLEEELDREEIPPSRIDLERACQDGLRLHRKRQAVNTFAGVGVIGLCAALAAVLVPKTLNGTTQDTSVGSTHSATIPAANNTAPSPSVGGSGALTYKATVPASFGWLPDNVDYIITGPVGGGETRFSARASGYIPGGSGPTAGRASVYLTLGSTETTAGSTLKLYRIAGPKIGNAQGYWITNTAGDETNGGDPTLEWQTASGQWAEVDATDMGGDPLLTTVEHIAQTVHVGETDFAVPVQVKGLPKPFVLSQLVLTKPAHSTDSNDWQIFTSYTFGSGNGNVHDIAYVVAQGTDTGSLTGVGPKSPNTASDCKTADSIVYCATTTYSGGAGGNALPTATQLLSQVTVFGSNQSSWSPDLLVQ